MYNPNTEICGGQISTKYNPPLLATYFPVITAYR